MVHLRSPAPGGASASGHAATEGASRETASASTESSAGTTYNDGRWHNLGDAEGTLGARTAVETAVFLDTTPLAHGRGRDDGAVVDEGAGAGAAV